MNVCVGVDVWVCVCGCGGVYACVCICRMCNTHDWMCFQTRIHTHLDTLAIRHAHVHVQIIIRVCEHRNSSACISITYMYTRGIHMCIN